MVSWDTALLAAASIVAISTLARLMRRRRDELVADVQRQLDEHREAEKKAQRKAKQQEAA